MKKSLVIFLTSLSLLVISPNLVFSANCQGCCSSHGGVVCSNGITKCGDGTSLSSTCANKGCNDCGSSTTTYYRDSDNDGYGDLNEYMESVTQPIGYVTDNTDCDDNDSSIHPGAEEIPGDGVDQDCEVEEDNTTYYKDDDGDSFGDHEQSVQAESQPTGYVLDSNDCDDSNEAINPSVSEVCNGVDDNCDGIVDEGCTIDLRDAVLAFPSGTIQDTLPTYIWNQVVGATWYKLFIGDSEDKKIYTHWEDASQVCSDDVCSVTPELELSSGVYNWYVKSWNESDNIWSNGLSFTVQGDSSPPAKVIHNSPTGTTQDTTPTFVWETDPVSTYYKLWIGDSNGTKLFTKWYDASLVCSVINCSITLDSPLPSGDYEWYIKSWNENGKVWSDGMAFIVENQASYDENQISIANFNIQVFGVTKAGKPEVMTVLANTISEFDIVAIQEIRDISGTAIDDLETAVDSLGIDYSYVLGPRLGRTSSKEQYAYMYRTDKVEHIESYTYDDEQNDYFHREPFVGNFRAKGNKFDFVLITLHTDPDEATEEINALPLVVSAARSHFTGENDFIILGDLNADCSYFDENDQSSLLRADEYTWLIGNDADTNLASTSCAYDRIIITDGAVEDYSGNSSVYRFDQEYNLTEDFAKQVSDHYPVYSTFSVNTDTD